MSSYSPARSHNFALCVNPLYHYGGESSQKLELHIMVVNLLKIVDTIIIENTWAPNAHPFQALSPASWARVVQWHSNSPVVFARIQFPSSLTNWMFGKGSVCVLWNGLGNLFYNVINTLDHDKTLWGILQWPEEVKRSLNLMNVHVNGTIIFSSA